ncbi:ferredoxin [Krasilnikovia sp. MM14-A1259]|uniref:ferredoxin n=1 Tax=Krasilnikovia sp. MM14-A1259 TaxID=3373539 RepID=UPI00399CF817
MKVAVDTSLCIGSGMCALTAPAVFDQDPDEAVVVLLDPAPPPAQHAAVRLAVQRCPAAVITATED